MRAADAATGRQGFAPGWYGKIPATGDFIARRVPGGFCDAWGRWLQSALDGARAHLGERWPDDFLSMPVWRFVLSAGLVTPSAWAGVMAPSVDSVGRYFPLALASPLPSIRLDLVGTLLAARAWFGHMEELSLSAIEARSDIAALDAAIAERSFRAEWLCIAGGSQSARAEAPMDCLELARGEARAAWLAEASDIFGRTLLLCDELPPAGPFCAMMNGRWQEQGWLPRGVP